jgi:EmrB/QacA subfamily drug resistance transporter
VIGPQRPPCDKGQIEAVPCSEPPSRSCQRWILATTVLGSSMGFIDGSVVNVALPALQRELGAGAAAAQWIVNGYLLTLGALVLVGGAAADRFGRRLVFLLGVAGFAIASLACAWAPGPALLIVARLAQGAAAALLTPASLAILGATFPEAQRGRAVGIWAGAGALMAAAGPVLGGWLVDAVSWRAIFLLNLPIAIAATALAWRYVPETRQAGARGLDWRGALLAALGLGLATFGLTEAGTIGMTRPLAWLPLATGLVLLAVFLLTEARTEAPMVPLALFRSRRFVGANLLTLLLYMALGGALFFLPFALIRIQGWSAAAAGAALLPFSIIMGTLSGAAGLLADRIGARLPLTAGPLIAAAGLALFARAGSPTSYWTGVLPAVLVLAAGMTLSVAPLTSTVMAAAGTGQTGIASGVNNAVARVAGLLAVAVLSLVFSAAFDHALAIRLDAAGVPAEQRPPRGMALATVPASAGAELRDPELAAFAQAFRAVTYTAAGCAALGGLSAAVLLRKGRAELPEGSGGVSRP